jgi:hypothetical protein
LEVLAMVNQFEKQQTVLRWCNSDQQLADGLTKSTAQDKLRKFLMIGQKWNLHFDEEFVSAKKRRKIDQDDAERIEFSHLSWIEYLEHQSASAKDFVVCKKPG